MIINALKSIKKLCDKNELSNVQSVLSEYQIDHSIGTILNGTGMIEKTNGKYRWQDGPVTKETGYFVRYWSNLYKNHSK